MPSCASFCIERLPAFWSAVVVMLMISIGTFIDLVSINSDCCEQGALLTRSCFLLCAPGFFLTAPSGTLRTTLGSGAQGSSLIHSRLSFRCDISYSRSTWCAIQFITRRLLKVRRMEADSLVDSLSSPRKCSCVISNATISLPEN